MPVLIAHGDIDSFDRLVIIARREELVRPGLQDVELAAQLAARFADSRRIAVVAAAREPVKALFTSKHAVDLIVIGTHGRTGIAHLVMGSVAEQVVRTAACPVLSTRYPSTPQGG